MFLRIRTILSLTAAITLCGADAHAWTQEWQDTSPYSLRMAVSGNGVGINLSNNSGYGINFFDAHTGATFCTSPTDPARYYNNKAQVRATGSGNLFLAFYLNRTTANGPVSKMTVQAFRVDPPVAGQTPSCDAIWTWETPFTVPYLTFPNFNGLLARDGSVAGLIIADLAGNTVHTYLIDVNNGTTTDAVNDPYNGAHILDAVAGISPNGRYAFEGGSWVRIINPQTKHFGYRIGSNTFNTFGAAMSDSGFLLEVGTNTILLRHDRVDPSYPAMALDFNMPVPTATPFCIHASISPNGQVGAYSCGNAASTQDMIQSFAVVRSSNFHIIAPINNVTISSQVPTLQYQVNRLVATNRGRVFFGTQSDGQATPGSAPDLGMVPVSGAVMPLQAPGTAMDVYPMGEDLWTATLAGHENLMVSGSVLTHYAN
jgi:hypothetical protein